MKRPCSIKSGEGELMTEADGRLGGAPTAGPLRLLNDGDPLCGVGPEEVKANAQADDARADDDRVHAVIRWSGHT